MAEDTNPAPEGVNEAAKPDADMLDLAAALGNEAPPPAILGQPLRPVDAPPEPSRLHTYPDGSARVGVPPFPVLSPIEEAAAANRDLALEARQQAFAVSQGQKPPATEGMVTANEVVQAK